MPITLDAIVAATRRRVAAAKPAADRAALERMAAAHRPRGFRQALVRKAAADVAVIAELKKASPSKGLIRSAFDAASLAPELERSGAAALSVLTDEEFFQGSLENLRLASSNAALPCLRKDFIVDEFQLLEARAARADAVLLIVAALTPAELRSLSSAALRYELDVLCEAHDEDELKRALDARCELVGVNSRDLRTFQVDLNTAFRLASQFPDGVVRVAESGIHNGRDIARLRAAGYHAFLIGESLMAAEHPGQQLQALLAEAVAAIPAQRLCRG
jgi:indole-3-glycerol phosphate synthase